MRSIAFRFEDPAAFAQSLRDGDRELPVPRGESVKDGEWVLAVFEIGSPGRTTAAAARGLHQAPREAGGKDAGGNDAGAVLTFEERDWDKLLDFAQGSGDCLKTATVPAERPTQPSLGVNRKAGSPPSTPRPAPRGDAKIPSSGGSGSERRRTETAPRVASARVLLVDDERDIREVVGAMLDAVGLKVESATCAEEALERVRSATYDLVVLDWNLPGMTGIELCRLFRRDPSLLMLPVLFLTAHAASQDVVEAFASGADDYVVKPFRAPELGARIFGLLRRARMTTMSSDS